MSLARGSLRTFLESAKSNLHNAILNQQRVTLVSGNESCDLDSITSAIVLAYIRSNALPTTPLTNPSVNRHTPPSQYPPLYIPLLNIPQADIKIRPELLKLLPYANLEPSHLITLDDLSITAPAGLNPTNKETLQPNLTQLLLTDHNKVDGPLAGKFSDRIIGCIDHHVDEHVVPDPPPQQDQPRIITTAGSCTSLVTQYCRPLWDSITQDPSSSVSNAADPGQDDASSSAGGILDDTTTHRTWDAQIARLALASILIDTNCLQDETKTLDVDRHAVDYLEAKIKLAPTTSEFSAYDRTAFFNEIRQAKQDLSSLSLSDILRKDYKQWDNVQPDTTTTTTNGTENSASSGISLGISSVVRSVSWQIEQKCSSSRADYDKALSDFATQRGLDVYAVMTTSTSSTTGEFQRELLLRTVRKRTTTSGGPEVDFVQSFAQKFGDALGLKEWSGDGDGDEKGAKSKNENEGLSSQDEDGGSRGARTIQTKIWWVSKVENSRKQVAPMLRQAIEQEGSDAGGSKEQKL